MALAFRSSSTASNVAANTTSFTISKPSGVVNGDLMVMFTQGMFQAGVVSAGWTEILAPSAGGGYASAGTYYKIAASEGASYTCARDGDTSGWPNCAMILAYTGGATSQPAASGRSLPADPVGATTSQTPALLSPVAATDLTLICYGANLIGGPPTYGSTPSLWTSRGGVVSAVSGYSVGIRVIERLGSTEQPTYTSTSAQAWNISSVALAIPVVPTTPKPGSLMPFFI